MAHFPASSGEDTSVSNLNATAASGYTISSAKYAKIGSNLVYFDMFLTHSGSTGGVICTLPSDLLPARNTAVSVAGATSTYNYPVATGFVSANGNINVKMGDTCTMIWVSGVISLT